MEYIIENKVVDAQHAIMLKALDFNWEVNYQYKHFEPFEFHRCEAPENVNKTNFISAPDWEQVEEWLWKNHNLYLNIVSVGNSQFEVGIHREPDGAVINNEEDYFDSPITARRGGVRQAIKILHGQLTK